MNSPVRIAILSIYGERMRSTTIETEEQRRRRVVSRIRNELRVHLASDLVELARVGKLPEQWMAPAQLNALLDDSGYWAAHPHALATFFSTATCEDIVQKALEVLVCTHPDVWVESGGQFRPATRDWNAYAAEKANLIRRDFPGTERTAIYTGSDGASVLFAHDNYADDPRSRQEVMLLRQSLRDGGIPELGFGVSNDGCTWVMVVWSTDEAALSKALLAAWEAAFSH